MFRTLLCTVATIITFSAGMSSAATFDFRLDSSDDFIGGNVLSYSESGVDLSVTASGNRVEVRNVRNGLGVKSLGQDGTARITFGETLTFTVLGQRPIGSLISVVFERGDGQQNIDFLAGGETERLVLSETSGGSRHRFELSPLPPGTTQFSFIGTDPNTEQGVLISSIEIALVPVPAAILSLGTGLALLGGFGRLRRGLTRKRLLGKAAA